MIAQWYGRVNIHILYLYIHMDISRYPDLWYPYEVARYGHVDAIDWQ